jgi:16S rRNA G1207 methylase RsmC
MVKTQQRDSVERFAERYRVGPNEATRQIELAVIGGDWGANGYTTVDQADLLGQVLALQPGTQLLDLGAGRGWPGLYLAATTGCRTVLSDVPIEGLATATARAAQENLSSRATAVVAGANALPFPPASFDAIVHTDVLC